MNILFTCAGRRRYLLGYFKEVIGKTGKIIAADLQGTAPAFSFADEIELVPGVYSDKYINSLLSICKKHQVDLVISLNDLELPILSQNRHLFEEIGARVLVSSPGVIDTCFDKYKTAQFIASIGLCIPKTYVNLENVIRDINMQIVKFPLVVKPRWGSGSIGIEYVDDLQELKIVYALLKKKIKKTILAEASSNDECILIQEKILGSEYGLDIMNDLKGRNRGVSVKQKLAMRAGETDKAVTVDNKYINDIGKKIGNSLSHIGNLDCDILEQNGSYYILELNPRFGGGYPFSHEAGVNFPKAIVNWVNGLDVPDECFQPRIGEMFSKCDMLVRIKDYK